MSRLAPVEVGVDGPVEIKTPQAFVIAITSPIKRSSLRLSLHVSLKLTLGIGRARNVVSRLNSNKGTWRNDTGVRWRNYVLLISVLMEEYAIFISYSLSLNPSLSIQLSIHFVWLTRWGMLQLSKSFSLTYVKSLANYVGQRQSKSWMLRKKNDLFMTNVFTARGLLALIR